MTKDPGAWGQTLADIYFQAEVQTVSPASMGGPSHPSP